MNCRGTADLAAVGVDLCAIIFIRHGLACHANDHYLCSRCRSTPVESWAPVAKGSPDELTANVMKSTLQALRDLNVVSYESLDDKRMVLLTSLKRDNIEELSRLSEASVDSIFRFFLYVRLGIGQRPLAAVLGLGKSTISTDFNEVIKLLEEPLAALHLRFPRDQVIREHTPPLFAALLPKARFTSDGEYWRTESPADFDAQKSLYNFKGFHCAGALSLFCLDGSLWDVLIVCNSDGDHNDEMKLEYAYAHNCGSFKEFLEEGDEVVLDRYAFPYPNPNPNPNSNPKPNPNPHPNPKS